MSETRHLTPVEKWERKHGRTSARVMKVAGGLPVVAVGLAVCLPLALVLVLVMAPGALLGLMFSERLWGAS